MSPSVRKATFGGTYSLGPPQANMELVTAVGNSIYFASNAGGYGSELWRYVP